MYNESFAEFYYWRLAGGTEVDFIINDMEVAIESKATRKITVIQNPLFSADFSQLQR